MDILDLFQQGQADGLFTDYDIRVEGRESFSLRGGPHVEAGAHLFDIASLTKTCVNLVLLKMFSEGRLSPTDSFKRFVPAPQMNGDDRRLGHFMCNAVTTYGFDYVKLRDESNGNGYSVKDVLVEKGFRRWDRTYNYDNVSSTYLGILLESLWEADLEDVLREELLLNRAEGASFLFHPVARGFISAGAVVPTDEDPALRGRVHDPFSRRYEDSNLAVAGLFTDATMLARIFDRAVGSWSDEFYKAVASDQRSGFSISGGEPYGLGLDKPAPHRFEGLTIENPLIFTGYTGTRIFFARKPRITVSILTNFSLCRARGVPLEDFKAFCWKVLREAVRMQL